MEFQRYLRLLVFVQFIEEYQLRTLRNILYEKQHRCFTRVPNQIFLTIIINFSRDREDHDCQYCGKHFISLRKWKDHEKYHLKEIPNLHCQVCGAKCKTETYLKAHMERHGEKKFFCDYEGCGKSFAVKHDVKIHKRRAHCDDLDYVCKICGMAFRTWNYRRYHEETVHGLVKVKQQRNKRRPLPQVAAALQQQNNPEMGQNTTGQNLPPEQAFGQSQDQQLPQTDTGNINFNQFNAYQ